MNQETAGGSDDVRATSGAVHGRRVASASGMISAALAIGLTELAAGVLNGVPSLVAAIADRIVAITPGSI